MPRNSPAANAAARAARRLGPCRRCSRTASVTSTGRARKQRTTAVVAASVPASLTSTAEAEIKAAPAAAMSSGRRAAIDWPASLPVMIVLAYGADMVSTLGEPPDRSQSGFTADQLEAMGACAELINTGRSAAGEGLRDLADVQSLADRYAFHGAGGRPQDLARLRGHRACLDAIASACERGDNRAAIEMLNALLAQTGAVPQIVAHDGRAPHLHVSRPSAP